MIRYEEKISEIYGLGRPCSGRSTENLRDFLSGRDTCLPFIVPKSLHKFEKGMKLITNEGTFKYSFTLLPYMPLNECKKVIERSPRWQLAIDAGLDVELLEPDPEIFQHPEDVEGMTLIIANPLPDWNTLNEYLRKLISIERSMEDLRMKGEHIRGIVKRYRELI